MPTNEHGRIVETPTEARAAVKGVGLNWVLGVGTVAVIVIFALLWFGHFA